MSSAITFPQVDPQTGQVLREYVAMTADEVSGALSDANSAFQQWRKVSAIERVQAVSALADLLRSHVDAAAHLINKEMGKPVLQGHKEVMKCAYLVDWYAQNGAGFLLDREHPPLPGFTKSYVSYQPLGVILSIMPWNFPFWQVIRMAVPTIIAGNAVVLKHAPNCFGSSLMIEKLFASVPGLPAGIFKSLIIDVPDVTSVLEHPVVQGVALTGSERAGRAVAAKAGSLLKKAVVELGGCDGYAILADADIDAAAQAVVDGRILNTGQVCISPKRAIVERSVKAEFEQKIVDKLGKKTYGVDFGPMVHRQGRQEVARQIQASLDAGARLLAGGIDVLAPAEDTGGAFLAPTVLTDVKPGMAAFDEEVFGPVVCIVEAEDERHAVELANQTHYGLGSAVFTADTFKGERIATHELEVIFGSPHRSTSVREDDLVQAMREGMMLNWGDVRQAQAQVRLVYWSTAVHIGVVRCARPAAEQLRVILSLMVGVHGRPAQVRVHHAGGTLRGVQTAGGNLLRMWQHRAVSRTATPVEARAVAQGFEAEVRMLSDVERHSLA